MTQIPLINIFSGSLWQIIGDTSAFGIFILLSLVAMSIVSWSIVFNKYRQFKVVDYDTSHFLQQFRRINRIADAISVARQFSKAPVAQVYIAGYEEARELFERKNQGGALQETTRPLDDGDFEIMEMTMERALGESRAILEKQVVFLATTASSAPFSGLLGTVVGIMDSFWSIGERGSASLAVVAPGIAEALLATIVGLGTAIPAVIAYNWANNKTRRLTNQAERFILEFLAKARKEQL